MGIETGARADAAMREKLGLIHIYCGDGKGKTTASIGLSVRARGRGLRVLFTQFLKTGTSGELALLRELGVDVISGQPSNKFVFLMNDDEKKETRAYFQAQFQSIAEKCRDGYDLLVLDEIMGAMALNMVDEADVLAFLKTKPEHLEVVLTGRGPSAALMEDADYVSEVVMRKHPYETSGTPARKGIEF